jgi:hypothetical protein
LFSPEERFMLINVSAEDREVVEADVIVLLSETVVIDG